MVTGLIVAGAFGLFLSEQQWGASLAEARTTAMNVIVLVETFYLFNCRSLRRSMYSVGLFSNRWLLAGVAAMLLAQLLITYVPLANRLLHTAPLSWDVWVRIVSIGAIACAVVEFEKWVRAKLRKRNPTRE